MRPDRSPRGTIYGDIPLESLNAGAIYTFPQIRGYKALKLTLANGGTGLVLNALVNWGTSQGLVSGAAAILTVASSLTPGQEGAAEAAKQDDLFLFGAAEIQIGSLDVLMGVAPIGEKTDPRRALENGKFTWTAATNPEAALNWGDNDGNTLKVSYQSKVNAFDFYNVSIRFAPLLRINLAEACSVFDIVARWLDPIRGIASLATGRSQTARFFGLRPTREEGPWSLAQVFGTALFQEPFDSSTDQVRHEPSVLRCAEDGVSLLDMVRAWWKLEEEHHPLIDTYAGMLHVKDSHPRSRFLLLIQSLEGMYGHDNRNEFERRHVKHKTKRDDLLAAVNEHLSSDQKRFLKSALGKEPARNLEEALNAAFDLPAEFEKTRESLEGAELVTRLVAETGCEPLGALRIARNGLAHGTRDFPVDHLHEVNDILDRLVRAHALRLLGCPPPVLVRLAESPDH